MNAIVTAPVETTEYQKPDLQTATDLDLPIDVLQAAILFAGKQDTRFYLCSVALNQGHIVATDGHRLLWCPWDIGALNLIIPRDTVLNVIAKWKKLVKKERPAYVQLSRSSKDHWAINIVGGGSELFAAIDAKYPEWQRVIKGNPTPQSSDPDNSYYVSYNWDYLADAKKASLLIHGKTPILLHKNQSQAGHIIFNSLAYPEAKALIMPMRD